jgi:hypothetical protein
MNVELRNSLQKRLAFVDAQLFIMRDTAGQMYPYTLFYEQRKVWGISDGDLQKLVQLFWGKNRLESTIDTQNRPARAKYLPLSPVNQRFNLVNGCRSARQRSVACQVRHGPRLTAFARRGLFFIDPQFALTDLIRYLVMKGVFGESLTLRNVYPCLDIRKIHSLAMKFSKTERSEKTLADYGFDIETIASEIDRVLRHP